MADGARTALRGALSQRTYPDVTLRFFANSVLPPGATGAGFRLSDTAHVHINRGITAINTTFLITSYKVLFVAGNEFVRVGLSEPL